MKLSRFHPCLTALLFCCGLITTLPGLSAQVIMSLDKGAADSTRRDQWLYTNQSGYQLAQRQVKLTPQMEAQPALSVTLIPNEFDLLDGNAAVQYLQALAFAERHTALAAMIEFHRKSRQAVEAMGQDSSQAEPYVWLETSPDSLPLERVREYLQHSSFQPRYLKQAALRRHCDFDRNIRAVDNPIGYLLPEIQVMRELARLQSMRFRLAIAEDRPQDAIGILGQQLAMGRHLGSDEFLVSNLVGIAVAGMGASDAYYLSEQAISPNLYWAIAALPQPLVGMREALAYEREILFEQFKPLREVDETPRSAVYWQRLVADLAVQLESWGDFGLGRSRDAYSAAGMTTLVAAAYPGAKLFLVEERGMDYAAVETLPVAQAVMLAARHVYERMRDEVFKLQYLPATQRTRFATELVLQKIRDKYGFITALSDLFLPAISATTAAQEQLQQQLAMLQTIEAIRDFLARYDGQLPKELSELVLPAPHDPVSQQPFAYRLEQGRALLSGAVASRLKFEIELVPSVEK